jgi:hypothetical protein
MPSTKSIAEEEESEYLLNEFVEENVTCAVGISPTRKR